MVSLVLVEDRVALEGFGVFAGLVVSVGDHVLAGVEVDVLLVHELWIGLSQVVVDVSFAHFVDTEVV